MPKKEAVPYRYLNTSLKQFTQSKYHRDFTKYRFRDLTEKFLQDFVVWIQVRAAKSGNSGDVSGKLQKLKTVCLYAKEQGVYNVNLNDFQSFKEKIKQRITTLKGVSPEVIHQIETFDRMLLIFKENSILTYFCLVVMKVAYLLKMFVCSLGTKSKVICLSMTVPNMTSRHE